MRVYLRKHDVIQPSLSTVPYIGELFPQYRVSATVLDEVEAHPGHQVEELGDYFRDTYAGASKLFMIPIYPLNYKMYQSQKVQEKEFMAKTKGRQLSLIAHPSGWKLFPVQIRPRRHARRL
jgi:hypothetical protein